MALLTSPLQFIISTPPATRIHTVLLFVLSCGYYWLRWRQPVEEVVTARAVAPWLTLIPGSSWVYPWTLLSSCFVEKTVIELIASIIAVPLSLRYLERLWGTAETVRFVIIVLVLSNVVAVVVSWLEFFVLGAEFLIYGMEYHGQMALQTGILVAFTQLIPEHHVQLFGVLKIRVKRLPMLYVTLSTALCLIGWQDPFILIQFGWLISWGYLRFYKRTGGENGAPIEYGDRSETFAFVYWFPPFIHYPVGILSNVAYNLALRIKLVRPHTGSVADLEGGGYASLPGGARAEAERRRAMALKALDQRMANSTPGPATSANPPSSTPSNPASSSQPARKMSAGSSGPPKQANPGASSGDIADAAGEGGKPGTVS